MGKFYLPLRMAVDGVQLIIYPCAGVESVFDRTVHGCLEAHVKALYAENASLLRKGAYHVLILWNNSKERMTDVWLFDKLDSWGSGPLADVKVFRGLELEQNIGVTAGDGLILLGREEELRRRSASLADYLDGPRPELPSDIAPKSAFYV